MSTAKSRESFISNVLRHGYVRAAQSFSMFLNTPIRIVNAQPLAIGVHNSSPNIAKEKGMLCVLTTQLIGDFPGRSYLIFNEDEYKEVGKTLKRGNNKTSDDFKEALMLEIDNVISAGVIAELSNALKAEIYGDVPILKKFDAKNLESFITADSEAEPSKWMFTSAWFQFEGQERVHPQFIWKISTKIFDRIPEEKISM